MSLIKSVWSAFYSLYKYFPHRNIRIKDDIRKTLHKIWLFMNIHKKCHSLHMLTTAKILCLPATYAVGWKSFGIARNYSFNPPNKPHVLYTLAGRLGSHKKTAMKKL